MKRILKILGIGIAACLGLSILSAIINPNRNNSASPAATPTSAPIGLVNQSQPIEPSPVPTIGVLPTEVAAIATAAPVPTDPPLPTATSEAPPMAAPATPAGARVSPQGDSVNVRGGPGTDYAVVTALTAGQSALVIGRNAAGDWLQIEQGWVRVDVVTVTGDTSQVAVVEASAPAAAAVEPVQPVVEQSQPTIAVVDAGPVPVPATEVPVVVEAPAAAPLGLAAQPAGQCDPAYPDVCIPSPPPDLNCGDVAYKDIRVVIHPDPHGLDGNEDGIGCES